MLHTDPRLAPARIATPAANAWPPTLNAIFVLCCLSIVLLGGQIALNYGKGFSWGKSVDLQLGYWALAWLLTAIAVVLGVCRRRGAFGVVCLCGCTLHVGFSSYFNFTIARFIGGARVPWGTYVWNWAAVALNAGVCFYILRYERPRWNWAGARKGPGFPVAGPLKRSVKS